MNPRPAYALGLVALLVGCAGAEAVRQYTYPPDFAYIEKNALHTSMGNLATQSRQLDKLLREHEPGSESSAEAARILSAMLATVDELSGSPQHTNHPLLDAHLSTFRRDVQLALEGAKATPPNYFFAGSVATSCTYCHR